MKKIGISIPWDYLSGNIVTKDGKILKQNFGNAADFLKFLKDLEVTHVELRHRKEDISKSEMKSVFQLITDSEFQISIHGDSPPNSKTWTINQVFPWIEAFKNTNSSISNPLMVTLHPYKGKKEKEVYRIQTVEFVRQLSDKLKKSNLPINLALENQRNKGFIDPGTSFFEIEQMWKDINRNNVGICWDMGHCFANYLIDNSIYPLFPHNKFTKAVTHTHIHDLGPDGRTHWIFKENKVPLAENVSRLIEAGYSGIYNLELSFDRFASEKDQSKLLKDTIIKLQEMV